MVRTQIGVFVSCTDYCICADCLFVATIGVSCQVVGVSEGALLKLVLQDNKVIVPLC